MSIYDDKKVDLKFHFSWKDFKWPILAMLALILVLAVAFTLSVVLQPKALYLKIEPNPLDLSDPAKPGYTSLNATVYNITGKNASNVLIEVKPLSKDNVIVFPQSQTILMLGTTEKKSANFILRANPNQKIFAGEYEINVTMKINSIIYTEKAILTIKTE